MMEAARTSETLVNFYQTTRCYSPEDSHLHTHHHENLKSYIHVLNICQNRNTPGSLVWKKDTTNNINYKNMIKMRKPDEKKENASFFITKI
jgi:hypothetical protein